MKNVQEAEEILPETDDPPQCDEIDFEATLQKECCVASTSAGISQINLKL